MAVPEYQSTKFGNVYQKENLEYAVFTVKIDGLNHLSNKGYE
jgi:hypothetical protein